MATTEDMSQSSAADGIKMLPKSDLVGKNQESREHRNMNLPYKTTMVSVNTDLYKLTPWFRISIIEFVYIAQ